MRVSNQLNDLELRNLLQSDINDLEFEINSLLQRGTNDPELFAVLTYLQGNPPQEDIDTLRARLFPYLLMKGHIRTNQERLATANNLLNSLLNDALARNQVRFYRDKRQAVRDFFHHIIDQA